MMKQHIRDTYFLKDLERKKLKDDKDQIEAEKNGGEAMAAKAAAE